MEDLSWQADEAIKQSRKSEHQRRLQEHARRKMEKEQARSKKDTSSFAAVRLSSWCYLIAESSLSTHVSNILVCNGHYNNPKERQHYKCYKWYIAFACVHTCNLKLWIGLLFDILFKSIFKLFTGHIKWIIKYKLPVSYWYKIIHLHVHSGNFSCAVFQEIST